MKVRVGFTLIEVMVAIILTSVVALLAYGTAHAGLDTQKRIERFRTSAEAHVIVRDLLTSALRHPVEGGGFAMNDTLFTIDDRISADGLPINAVRFVSSGVVAPLGATSLWLVTIEPGLEGVRIAALPLRSEDAQPIVALLTDVHGLRARVLDRTADTEWQNRWDVVGRVPAAVALEFLTERGEPAGPELVVHGALERVR
jgi:general secretion pathway protein J